MAVDAVPGPTAPSPADESLLAEFWRSFRLSRGGLAGLGVILALVLIALLAPYLAPHDPTEQFRDAVLTPPVWADGGDWTFPLGTDDIGRDMLSRLIHGARLSLLIGAIIVTLSLTAGVTLGVAAGFFPGLLDIAIMRLMDVLLALPGFLLAIVVAAILGPGLINATVAVSITALPSYARLARGAVKAELTRDYVVASRIAGARTPRVMLKVVLPNCLAPIIVQASLEFSNAILTAAALGFIGLGAQPPTPEWGAMLSSSLEYIERAWWIVTLPGIAILITVLAFNLLGDGLRDALDPKLKR